MDDPKLGLVFPSELEDEEIVAIPLTLPIGWKKSLPIFSMVTETVVDLSNAALHYNTPALLYILDDMVESIIR